MFLITVKNITISDYGKDIHRFWQNQLLKYYDKYFLDTSLYKEV
ncbi:hypothetical protein [Candidatus Jettenia sp. AMX1]|nr:hypothetical protein [Candidatus Jettenia sp. AMX1]WKZ16437.1 MAG: hypothetical protein QY317_03825 [Candidatus Jettenia caeni]